MRGLRGLGIQGLANPVFGAGCPGGGLMSTILSYNPDTYFPLNELSGTTLINYGLLGTAANGSCSNVTLANTPAPGGWLAPYWNGTTSIANVYSAALRDAYGYTAGTLLIWGKVEDAAVLTDATYRRLFQVGVDNTPTNGMSYSRTSTNNQFFCLYSGSSVSSGISFTNASVAWNLYTLTWDAAADQVKTYLNNAQQGATQTTIGAFAGVLTNGYCSLGARSAGLTQVWKGWLSSFATLHSVLTQPQIASIYAGGI